MKNHLGESPATVTAGIESAIAYRMGDRSALNDNGRRFASYSMVEMGRAYFRAFGVESGGMDRYQMAGLMCRSGGMHGSADFPSLLANVANKRLRQAYGENPGSFKLWARRGADARDFRPITAVNLAAMPDLLRTNEHGEFKYGAMTDGKETYSLLSYGRIVNLTRQAIVNDDLRGFDRMLAGFASSAARLENRMVYAELTANANLADGGALFNSTAVSTPGGHANLAVSGTAIDVGSLGAGRAAMRLQKGLQGEELDLAPAFLLVPAAREQLAYSYTSANYVPATSSAVNEFRSGGRASLQPVVEPLLDANSSTAWYLAANTGAIDTVEYCYLEGADAPQIDVQQTFGVDGVGMRCRHDFAAKVLDFRGLYKNPGA